MVKLPGLMAPELFIPVGSCAVLLLQQDILLYSLLVARLGQAPLQLYRHLCQRMFFWEAR